MTDYQLPNQQDNYPVTPETATQPTVEQAEYQEAASPTPQRPVKLLVLAGIVILLLLSGLLLFTRAPGPTAPPEAELPANLDQVIIQEEDLPAETVLPAIPSDMTQELPVETTISVQSPSEVVTVGQAVTLQIIAASDQAVDGVEFVLTYDPTLLSNVSMTKGTTFSTFIREEVNGESGRISVGMIANPGETVTLGANTVLVTITGTAARPGEAVFSFEQNRTMVAAGGGQNILKNTRGLSLMIQ
jgi:hypothetical protein